MKRPGFIGALFAGLALALPKAALAESWRDDTDRVQRLLDEGGHFPSGTYYIRRPVTIRVAGTRFDIETNNTHLNDNHFSPASEGRRVA